MSADEGPTEWPHWDSFSDVPVFNTKAVVQQTGIPAPTLRAWERRYHLLTPKRAENAYRLYSERDVALIRWLKTRVDEGIAISQAVALFRHRREEESGETFTFQIDAPGLSEPEGAQASADTRVPDGPDNAAQFRGMLPHSLVTLRDHLIEVFSALDEPKAHVMMGTVLSLYPIEQVCVEVILPTMERIEQLRRERQLNVSVEHFAGLFFRALLTNRFFIAPGPLYGSLILVGCAPGEWYELEALMLALLLRLRGMRVTYLGQNIDGAGLLHTIRHLRPAMICLSITQPSLLPDVLALGEQVQRQPEPRPLFTCGGQAFTPTNLAQLSDKDRSVIDLFYTESDLREVTTRLCTMVRESETSA